jgi:peptidoglycan hydrolase CwlO-like protein
MLALLVAGAAVAWATAVPAGAQTDPLAEADEAVASARAEADAAAGAYFEILNRSQTIAVEIERTEQQLSDLTAQMKRLRREVRDRAALAYVRSGNTTIDFSVRSDEEALEAARRATLLNRLNETDRELAGRLADMTATVEAKRSQLDADRAAFEKTLERLRDEQAQLDAKLAAAQARHSEAIALEEERRAQEESAAAAAAAAPPPSSAPESSETTEATTTAEPANAPNAPAAPIPPPDYEPTPGEHPQHWHPFLTCTRAIESSGNYQAYNPDGPYYGAYQFLQSTWNSAANHAGRGELIGVKPSDASQYDQDDMAWTLYQWQGKGPWGGRC